MPSSTETTPLGLPLQAIRHSACFYFGLFPIVILLWAWADSVTNHTNWYHRTEEGTRGFIVTDSKFVTERIIREPDHTGPPATPVPFYGGIRRFGAALRDAQGNPLPLFPPLDWHDEEATHRAPGFHVDRWVVPLWFVLACYVPVWVGLSYLSARRKLNRFLAELPQLPVEPPPERR